MKQSDTKERVWEFLSTTSQSYGISEISDEVNASTGAVRDAIDDLVTENRVEEVGDDRYRVDKYAALAEMLREVGVDTDEGLLITWEVIDEWESGGD